jgi:hypothetical protein
VEQKPEIPYPDLVLLSSEPFPFTDRTLNWEDTHIMQQQFLLMAKCFLGMEADYVI